MRQKAYFEEYLATGPVKQYLLHYKARPDDPVMLIVHGGPGFSLSNNGHVFKKQWEDAFTLVFWDQRGCGKTLSASGEPDGGGKREPDESSSLDASGKSDVPEGQKGPDGSDAPAHTGGYSITFDDIMDDLHAVVTHLKQFYKTEKIALLGQSYGSIVGSHYACRHPENLSVYIGMCQVVNWDKNWKMSYERLLEQVKAAGDTKSERIIASWGGIPKSVSAPNLTDEILKQLKEFNKLRSKYKMTMSLTPKLMWDFFTSPVFKFSDLSFLQKASAMRNRHLVEQMLECDLEQELPLDYAVPVAYILGNLDYQAVYTLAVEYFEKIRAPKKYLNVIEGACHNIVYDQPVQFAKAIWGVREMIS